MGRRWPKLPDTLTNRCLPHSNGFWITNFYTFLGRESHLISQQLMSRWGGVNKHDKWHMSACSTLFKDKSWLSSPSTSSTTTKSDVRMKLPSWKPWFTGIIKIKKQVSPVAYILGLPSIYIVTPSFHVSLLKPAVSSAQNQVPRAEPPSQLEIYRVCMLLVSKRWCNVMLYLWD